MILILTLWNGLQGEGELFGDLHTIDRIGSTLCGLCPLTPISTLIGCPSFSPRFSFIIKCGSVLYPLPSICKSLLNGWGTGVIFSVWCVLSQLHHINSLILEPFKKPKKKRSLNYWNMSPLHSKTHPMWENLFFTIGHTLLPLLSCTLLEPLHFLHKQYENVKHPLLLSIAKQFLSPFLFHLSWAWQLFKWLIYQYLGTILFFIFIFLMLSNYLQLLGPFCFSDVLVWTIL